MAADIYPDATDIYARLAAIQSVIEPISLPTGTPGASVDNLPYWLTEMLPVTTTPIVRGQYEMVFTFDLVLLRYGVDYAQSSADAQIQIGTDQINTVKEFNRRLNLQSTAYPTDPAGFKRDSVRIESRGYGEWNNKFAGSMCTVTFSYNIFVAQSEMF